MSYAPRRWNSYRSLAEQDEISPDTKHSSPKSLVDICVNNVLQSYKLVGDAGRALPSVQAHYILYLALKRLINGEEKSYMILHRLISSWGHPELKFDFQSNFLVQRHIFNTNSSWRSCLTAPYNYYGLKGILKTRFELCARDIAVGLFNHIYHALTNGTGEEVRKPTLKTIDMSEVLLATEPHPIWGTGISAETLYTLSRGEFPGRAAYECLSPEDFLYIGTKKPTLHNLSSQNPVHIDVNLSLSTLENIQTLVESSNHKSHYRLQTKVLDISNINKPGLNEAMKKLDLAHLGTLIVSGSQELSAAVLGHAQCVWSLQDKTTETALLKRLVSTSKALRHLIVSVSNLTASSVLEVMGGVSDRPDLKLKSLSVFGGGGSSSNYSVLGNCLTRFGPDLEYLHLINWLPACIPTEKLALCENLRVLSIIGKESFPSVEQSIGNVFKVLQSFKKLEYLELYQNSSLKAPDLVQLRLFLINAPIVHCHINFSGLTLKRADLDVQSNGPVHQLIRMCLGSGTRGNSLLYRQAEHFSFKFIKGWLNNVKPKVCYELDHRDSSMFNDLVHLKGRRHFL